MSAEVVPAVGMAIEEVKAEAGAVTVGTRVAELLVFASAAIGNVVDAALAAIARVPMVLLVVMVLLAVGLGATGAGATGAAAAERRGCFAST